MASGASKEETDFLCKKARVINDREMMKVLVIIFI
jgi:hypothetical protein